MTTEQKTQVALEVIRAVSGKTGIAQKVILTADRHGTKADRGFFARRLAMALCIERGMDYAETAEAFGRTTLAVCRAVDAMAREYRRNFAFQIVWNEMAEGKRKPIYLAKAGVRIRKAAMKQGLRKAA